VRWVAGWSQRREGGEGAESRGGAGQGIAVSHHKRPSLLGTRARALGALDRVVLFISEYFMF
jgi:hypothetical protein